MKHYLLGVILLFLAFKNDAQQLRFQNQDLFLNGANIPWQYFGWDFGEHNKWNRGYDSTYFEKIFVDLEAHGVNTVRMWVHCDGRATPEFDENGFVIGLDQAILDEMEDFLVRAKRHNLLVNFTLWSHNLLENNTKKGGALAGLHQDLIVDEEKTESYLKNALIPMVQSLNHHCNLLAWEIISEPEWCMRILGGAKTTQTVSVSAMQRFVGKCIEVIRENSSQMITVGSAYPCSNNDDMLRNFWAEAEFEKLGFDSKEVYLDFYSFHYFEWMSDKKNVFEHNLSHWNLNKPVVIAESAVKNKKHPMLLTGQEQLDYALKNNYAGVLFWSVHAGDKYSKWKHFKDDLLDFSKKHDVAVDINCNNLPDGALDIQCSFYPNPVQDVLRIKYKILKNQDITVRLYDTKGRLILTFLKELSADKEDDDIFVMKNAKGVYRIEVWQEHNGKQFKAFVEKIVKI